MRVPATVGKFTQVVFPRRGSELRETRLLGVKNRTQGTSVFPSHCSESLQDSLLEEVQRWVLSDLRWTAFGERWQQLCPPSPPSTLASHPVLEALSSEHLGLYCSMAGCGAREPPCAVVLLGLLCVLALFVRDSISVNLPLSPFSPLFPLVFL